MTQNHPYRDLQVPSDAPFVLRPSSGKGWGAFATRPIDRGTMILSEKPQFVIRKPHQEIMEGDLWAAFNQLGPMEKNQFLILRDNISRPFKCMTDAFAENSFAIAEDNSIHGLLILLSRFNHSCVPNSRIPTCVGETLASYATQDIVAGEEITFCYNTDFECRIRNDRHQVLRFVCDCKACRVGTPFQQLSDMRRKFIRALEYVTLGVDIDGQRQRPSSPIITDPELQEAAETLSISIAARLIYRLLAVCLLEEEGLLDDFMVERLYPGILEIAALFNTENNVEIARLAMI